MRYVVLALLLGVSLVDARTIQPTKPATQQNVEHLTATVVSAIGIVELRDDETAPWRRAAAGMNVPIGGECRTGPRSLITLSLPGEQQITLDRLGVVKILEALKTDTKLKTDLGMRYGRVRYRIEGAGLEHESTIRSPSSALAVRGTDVVKTDDGLSANVVVYKGVVQLPVSQRRGGDTVTLGKDPEASYEKRPITMSDGDDSPAETELRSAATPYSSASSLTGEEKVVTNYNLTVGGINSGVTDIAPDDGSFNTSLLPPPVIDSAIGTLSFVLKWMGEGSSKITPDIDLFVITPKDVTLRPKGNKPFLSSAGALVSANDRGGKGGREGTESIVWQNTQFSIGRYTYGVTYNGEGEAATYRISVVQDGRHINARFVDTITPSDRQVRLTADVLAPPPAQNARKATRKMDSARTAGRR